MSTVSPPPVAPAPGHRATAHAADELRPGVTRISVNGPDATNVYLLGNVLVDSGSRFTVGRLLPALAGRRLKAHALTHAHFDHQGASAAVCRTFGIPLWCGEGDRVAVETGSFGTLVARGRPLAALSNRVLSGPPHPVERVLTEGDEVADFVVVETAGHTPGHLAFWRERDRVLVLGDVLFHRNPVTRRLGLREPFRSATWGRERNLAAARRLADLRPELVCFGHGPPLTNGARFREFVASLR
jgi:glyoxylase-like metal-dependent hydrolase (beta-lactamase superfamily II)